MKHLTLSDRIRIEAMLGEGKSFSQIAKELGKYPSTISREIRSHRSVVVHYSNEMTRKRSECERLESCTVKSLCGNPRCDSLCSKCRSKRCTLYCKDFSPKVCELLKKPPYVCNTCPEKKLYSKDRFFYSAKHAQASVDRRRSESRKGLSNHGRAASGVRYSADKTGEERTTFDAHLRYTQGRNSGQFNGRIQSLGMEKHP